MKSQEGRKGQRDKARKRQCPGTSWPFSVIRNSIWATYAWATALGF